MMTCLNTVYSAYSQQLLQLEECRVNAKYNTLHAQKLIAYFTYIQSNLQSTSISCMPWFFFVFFVPIGEHTYCAVDADDGRHDNNGESARKCTQNAKSFSIRAFWATVNSQLVSHNQTVVRSMQFIYSSLSSSSRVTSKIMTIISDQWPLVVNLIVTEL